METIKTFEELEKFLNTNKGFNYYIANPMRRKFIKFDKEFMPDLNCYLIESEEQEITLVKLRENKIKVIKVSIEQN